MPHVEPIELLPGVDQLARDADQLVGVAPALLGERRS